VRVRERERKGETGTHGEKNGARKEKRKGVRDTERKGD